MIISKRTLLVVGLVLLLVPASSVLGLFLDQPGPPFSSAYAPLTWSGGWAVVQYVWGTSVLADAVFTLGTIAAALLVIALARALRPHPVPRWPICALVAVLLNRTVYSVALSASGRPPFSGDLATVFQGTLLLGAPGLAFCAVAMPLVAWIAEIDGRRQKLRPAS